MAANEFSLAYHEPSITTIIILSGFLLLLNTVNYGLDKLVYCGLIGQVFLGIAWGTPGAKWLSEEMENSIMQLGYLGLILIVYEGGLSTSFKSLKANLLLSIGVAITGIAVPIGLSFTLQSLVGASPLQAFAAGAALCSTSLGTTFTVLGTSGLSTTRLGVVLTSAAMMDDVVGLIMVQVVSNLGGGGGGGFNAVTVIRPVFVSLGFSIVVPAVCKLIIQPVTLRLNAVRENNPGSKINRLLQLRQTAFVIHTSWLFGLVVGGTFAGTSSLLAAYVAGATVSWWDSEVPHVATRSNDSSAEVEDSTATVAEAEPVIGNSGVEIYENYYQQAVERVLKPFFFASIGFSVPITRLFSGPIVWRGVVYTILMMIGKILCGFWLLSYASPLLTIQRITKRISGTGKKQPKKLSPGAQCNSSTSESHADNNKGQQQQQQQQQQTGQGNQTEDIPLQPVGTRRPEAMPKNASPQPEMPVSVYPACILGFAMVARGEIGFLISAVAESTGIFSGGSGSPAEPSELFLIVTWAISLCTIVGPISVGLLVNRVKRLELHGGKGTAEGRRNVLGSWGVS
ncbi:sodium/hydrogen exchanger family protein [Colletotrichum truncatum]|uniref:Sodium/hydrogen exchanger family protein n=1 Tax=Colletotrichum truncatum TaxID=5467 RepID=A0ACC3ZBS6_COLTU|nr:sodium/hydrogen exchanger family protein [Colletotrichum truncatum]KAF6783783.1 sodium/hydrogen exchanger family protein [Colletotrichum truncatum]